MAKIHGGQIIARALKAEGVEAIFMLTGGHILPIVDGCEKEGIKVVDVRHEQAAAHAADAYARLTGKLGVAVVTAGPGVTDALTGVANAWFANTPMLLLGGRNLTDEDLRGGLQEMDHPRLFESITKWAATARTTSRLAEYIATAARHAFSGRSGPVFLDIPFDVQADTMVEDSIAWPTGYRPNRPAGVDAHTLAEICELLKNAANPVVFAGTGMRWSRQDDYTGAFAAFADALGAPVYTNSLARGSLAYGHPLLGNQTRSHALKSADVVLALGVDWDFRTSYGAKVNSQATVIHIDAEPTRIGWNRTADLGVAADPGTVVAQLTEAAASFASPGPREWTTEVFAMESAKRAVAEEAAASDNTPIHPERFARDVADFFSDDSIVCADGGDIVSTTAKWLQTSRPGGLLDPGPFGCLGVGAPFAIAAKTVEPDTRVGIVYGDGSFGFNAMEYDTMIRHAMPVIGVIGNDGAWNNIKTVQRMMYPDIDTGSDLGIRPYGKMVEALGGYGEFVTDPKEIIPALRRAQDSGVASLINVHIGEQIRVSSVYGF